VYKVNSLPGKLEQDFAAQLVSAIATQQRSAILVNSTQPGARFTNVLELFLTQIINAILDRLRINF
jgi:hypothetical protein